MKFFAGVAAGVFISLVLLLGAGYLALKNTDLFNNSQQQKNQPYIQKAQAQTPQAEFTPPSTPEELLQLLNRQIAANPSDTKAHIAKAALLAEMGRHEEAVKAYDKAIFLNPTDPAPYLNRAVSYFALGDFVKAKEDLSTAVTLNPQLAEAYFNRGVANINMSMLKPALDDFQKAAVLFSKNNDNINADNSLKAAAIIKNYAKSSMAAKAAKKAPPAQKPQDLIAIKKDSGLAKQYTSDLVAGLKANNGGGLLEKFKNASAGAAAGQGFDENSFATFEDSIYKTVNESGDKQKAMPKTVLDYRSDAQKNMREQNYAAAVADLDKAIEKSPNDASLYTERGMANAAQKNTKDAIADFTKAIAANPKDAGAYYNRAQQKSLLGDTKGAIADAQKAAEIAQEQGNEGAKEQAENMANMLQGKSMKTTKADGISQQLLAQGNNAYNSGNYKEAVSSFDALIAREGKKGNSIPELYYNRAIANAAAGNDDAALADYKKAPHLPDAQVGAGTILAKQGKNDEAKKYFDKAIEMNPEHSAAYRMRGMSEAQKMEQAKDQRQKEQYKENALKDLDQSISLNPKDAQSYMSRGLVYANSGDLEKAEQDLQYSENLARQSQNPELIKEAVRLNEILKQVKVQQSQGQH